MGKHKGKKSPKVHRAKPSKKGGGETGGGGGKNRGKGWKAKHSYDFRESRNVIMEISEYSMTREARNTERHANWGDRTHKLRDMKINFVDAGFLPPIIPQPENGDNEDDEEEQTESSEDGHRNKNNTIGAAGDNRISDSSADNEQMGNRVQRPITPQIDKVYIEKQPSSPSSIEEEIVFVPRQHRALMQSVVTAAAAMPSENGVAKEETTEKLEVAQVMKEESKMEIEVAESKTNGSGAMLVEDDNKYFAAPTKSEYQQRETSNESSNGGKKHRNGKPNLYTKNLNSWLGGSALSIPMGEVSHEWSPVDPITGELLPNNPESGAKLASAKADESDSASDLLKGISEYNLASSFANRDIGGGIVEDVFYPKKKKEHPKKVSQKTVEGRKQFWGDDDFRGEEGNARALELLNETVSKMELMPNLGDTKSASEEDDNEPDNESSDSEDPGEDMMYAVNDSEDDKGEFEFDNSDLLALVSGMTPDVKKTGGVFPSAPKVAEAFDYFDIMDYSSSSVTRKKGKGKGKLAVEDVILDEDIASQLLGAKERARERKKMKKSERESQRKSGMLGKAAGNQPNLRAKYPTGMTMTDIKHEFKGFLSSQHETIFLPPMAKNLRKQVHLMASRFFLVSKSLGTGAARYTTLHKTKKSSVFENDEDAVDALLNGTARYRYNGGGGAGGSGGGISKRGGGGSSYRLMDGDIVGGSAFEIPSDNKGRMMLEKLGWQKGFGGLGIRNHGIIEPIQAIIKSSRRGLG